MKEEQKTYKDKECIDCARFFNCKGKLHSGACVCKVEYIKKGDRNK